ncbi:MAG: hypothetical protein ALMCE001_12450 [Methanocorpusculum sp. MCE]|nr:MAG: hypothetical protein ALMCE001_12450 [Methanocorpusculum sp. MCE]
MHFVSYIGRLNLITLYQQETKKINWAGYITPHLIECSLEYVSGIRRTMLHCIQIRLPYPDQIEGHFNKRSVLIIMPGCCL